MVCFVWKSQEIEKEVEGLRNRLDDPSTTNDGGGSLLAQIDVMFGDLMLDLRILRQQKR